jgi:predicted transposase/invertase (TIGR01784 family)
MMTAPDEQPLDDEPPIREFADRGVLWLLENRENLRHLVALLSEEIAARLDFAHAERDNRSFIPEDLYKQEADLLYRVPFLPGAGKGAIWIYVLLEHQSKPDRSMGLRLLGYMVKLWETQRRAWEDSKLPASQWRLYPILPIVFYTGKRRWKTPISVKALMSLPDLLERFIPEFDTLFLPLQTMSAERLTGSAVAAALRALQAADEPQEQLARVLSEAVRFLESLPVGDRPQWRRAMQYLFLLVHHKREPEEQAELHQMMLELMETDREEARKMARTSAQVLEARGHKAGKVEGKIEGKIEGRIEGQSEILVEQLEAKFGRLSAEVVEAVNRLSESRRRILARQILFATSLEELDLSN